MRSKTDFFLIKRGRDSWNVDNIRKDPVRMNRGLCLQSEIGSQKRAYLLYQYHYTAVTELCL